MARPAKAGGRLVLVACCDDRIYVVESAREAWRCVKCKSRGAGHVTVILPPAGAEPVTT